MKTGEFLTTLAAKCGKTNEGVLKDFVSGENHIDLPDEICSAIISELMSLEGAKNNSKVKGHFVAQALNGVDSEIASMTSDFGLDTDLFSDEKDTYAKLRKMKAALKEQLEKNPEKATELERQKKELQQKYIDLQRTSSEKEKTMNEALLAERENANRQVLDYIKNSSLKGLKWAYTDIPEDTCIEVAKTQMAKEMARLGVIEVNKDGKLELVMKSDPTLEYYENGKKVDYDTFKSKVLADTKLLAVTEQKKQQQPAYPNVGFAGSNYNHQQYNHNQNPNIQAYQSEVQRALTELKFDEN